MRERSAFGSVCPLKRGVRQFGPTTRLLKDLLQYLLKYPASSICGYLHFFAGACEDVSVAWISIDRSLGASPHLSLTKLKAEPQ